MDMLSIVMILSIIIIIASFLAIVYAFIKKKPVGRWIVLFGLTLLLPFTINNTLGKRENQQNIVEEGLQKPAVDESGFITAKKGEYVVGRDLVAGKYDFTVTDKYNDLSMGSDDPTRSIYGKIGLLGIKKFRLDLKDGDEIIIMNEAIFTPIETELLPFKEQELSPGIYYIGEDITAGEYNISSTTDSIGEVFIYEVEDQKPRVEISIGKDQEPTNTDIELRDGEILKVLNANFKLVPINN